jgi:hypothetical protein
MPQELDTDALWRRGMEAISEARDLIGTRRHYLEEATELAHQRLLTADASRTFAQHAARVPYHGGFVSPEEDTGKGRAVCSPTDGRAESFDARGGYVRGSSAPL